MNKVYVDDNDQAMIVCPNCGFEKIVDANDYRITKNMVEGQCKCKERFQFTLEYRKHFRKDVMLPGEYIVQKSGEKGELIVRELSMTGIRFETLRPHKMSTNDTLNVTFKLDNPMRSEVRRVFRIIWVSDRRIGANCIEPKLYEKDLGFYMQI
jgi:hypothetical protein